MKCLGYEIKDSGNSLWALAFTGLTMIELFNHRRMEKAKIIMEEFGLVSTLDHEI
jgi:hypothetical protein